jgi:photosystem II stability/assembly factor-like uncharacterized protein
LTVTLSPNGLDSYRSATPPDRVLVATIDGVVELHRSGATWAVAARDLRGVHVSALLGDPQGDAVYAGSHDHGLFRRADTGEWVAASTGITSENVFSLGCTVRDGRTTLFAGTEPAMLFQSSDGARSWEELTALRSIPGRESWDFPAPPNIAHAKHVDVDPRDPDVFYLSIEQGALLKTLDGGRTFRELSFKDDSYVYNKDAHRVLINPLNPDEIYLTGGDGVTRSADGGATWERVATPEMRVSYPDAAFCSPLTDGTIYAAGAGARPGRWRQTGDAEAAMARSRDRGRNWEVLDLPPLRGNIEAVTLVNWPGEYGFFAATTDGEVFASLDRGECWSLIASALPAVSKCVHYANVMKGRGAA